MGTLTWVLIVCGTAIAVGAAAFFAGIAYRKKIGEKLIISAEVEAKRIVSDAEKAAESKKKESLIEAKEEAIRIKNETEKELKEGLHGEYLPKEAGCCHGKGGCCHGHHEEGHECKHGEGHECHHGEGHECHCHDKE